jgi:hypothetical protein
MLLHTCVIMCVRINIISLFITVTVLSSFAKLNIDKIGSVSVKRRGTITVPANCKMFVYGPSLCSKAIWFETTDLNP